ncbi:MAG: hypothetical protein AMXMBFR72_30550 [Betaproteobacteria bacterium]|nr:MAG: hypothetical protein BroJett031_08880 [Betaproteobacteria bacterium]
MDDVQRQTKRQRRPQRIRPDDVSAMQDRLRAPVAGAHDGVRKQHSMVVAVGDDTDLHVFPLPRLRRARAHSTRDGPAFKQANSIPAAVTALPTEVGNSAAPFLGGRRRASLHA